MWTPGSGGGGGGAGGDASGPASSTDNAVARFDGAGGKTLQNSVVTISDAGAVAGVTQADVDNLRLDGNTLASTDSNGNILLDPAGTGVVRAEGPLLLTDGAAGAPALGFTSDPDTGLVRLSNGVMGLTFDGSRTWEVRFSRLVIQRNDGFLVLGSDEDFGWGRQAAAVGKACAGITGLGAIRQGQEVLARTTDLTLTTVESGLTYTNTGAGGQVIFTLPAATLTNNVGACFTFVVRAAQNIRIVAAGTDVINLPAAASAAGGRIDSNTVRSVVTVFVSATGFWDTQPTGTWTAT